jgi:hypothetical protein
VYLYRRARNLFAPSHARTTVAQQVKFFVSSLEGLGTFTPLSLSGPRGVLQVHCWCTISPGATPSTT